MTCVDYYVSIFSITKWFDNKTIPYNNIKLIQKDNGVTLIGVIKICPYEIQYLINKNFDYYKSHTYPVRKHGVKVAHKQHFETSSFWHRLPTVLKFILIIKKIIPFRIIF